jgi:hypothetical protein
MRIRRRPDGSNHPRRKIRRYKSPRSPAFILS